MSAVGVWPRVAAVLVVGGALIVSGCGSKATQVIVTVDAESGVRMDSARLHIVVLGGIGRTTAPTAARLDRVVTPGVGDPAYPFTVALAPLDGDVGRSYSVTATAETAAGDFVGAARIIGGYVEGETLTVRLVLEDACRAVACGAEQTCKAGVCVDARIGGDADAGQHDAGADDGGSEDAQAQDAGTIDAGADMGRADGGGEDGGGADSGMSDAGRCADGGCVDVAQLAVGSVHSCARLTDGTVRCWGSNAGGLLGDGTTTDRHTPTVVSGLSGAVDLVAGFNHTCARLTSGAVRCWGVDAYGELGSGAVTGTSSTPIALAGVGGVVELGLGYSFTCARLGDGTVWCWGYNGSGQLGDGTTIDRATPAAVPGLADVVELATYAFHSCARLTDGTTRCWGENSGGSLGDGTSTNRSTPVISVLSGLTGVAQLGLGYSHGGARLADGTVRCLGDNGNGELGDGTMTSSLSAVVATDVTGASELAFGNAYSCARLTGGTVRCWGANGGGQLGDGTLMRRTTSVEVAGLAGVVELASGASSSCARLSDGTVRCWGANNYGQLGDGTVGGSRSTPVAVVW